MKYSELFQFEPLVSAVQLLEANEVNGAERLVRTYVVSDEMADRLTYIVFPHLRLDHASGNKGLLIIGRHGTGKSHLMAVVSALAEHKVLAENLTNAEVADAVGAIAGKFKVLRVKPGDSTTDLRDSLCRQIAASLTGWGVNGISQVRDKSPHFRVWLEEMMAEFSRTFPEHGLLLVLDQLTDYLRDREGRAISRDLAFLQEMGAACGGLKFRFITELRDEVFDLPAFAKVANSFRIRQSHFVRITIPENDARCIVQGRLLRKTAEQQAKVREHLAPFTRFFGDMNQRMDEFIAMFPVHPDYFGVVGQIGFIERGNIVQILSDAVKKLLDEAVPEDRPGLIAYDSYWEQLRKKPTYGSAPEFQAVIKCSKLLQDKAAEVFKEPAYRRMALRIIHALSVHRLTTGSLYRDSGPTPSELRDMLCLCEPSVKGVEGRPADDLLSQVVEVFSRLHESVNGQSLAINPYNFQCYLRINRFKRFNSAELALHWVNAVPFLLLATTGGTMIFSRFRPIEPGLLFQVIAIHKFCATLWVFLLPLITLFRWKLHWEHLRVMTKWGMEDIVWMLESIRSLRKKDSPLTPVGRFNTGQKINACLVFLYFSSFTTTGVLMWFKASMLFPWYLHTALFFSAAASVGGHLYLALVNPSTRIALAGIFHGWSPLKYIEHHHPLSLPEALRAHAPAPQSRRLSYELLITRTELIAVSTAFALAVVVLAVFYHWEMAAIKKDFAKSFSKLINPSELSTKHRIGPTAESCTKCHSYTGEILDAKCELCHADIQARRANGIGYHGTLKGECIHCHKEHPARSPVLVPLNKDTFDHALANFKREGSHAQVACDECHKKKRKKDTPGIYYIGLKHELCTDCHDEPHRGQFTVSCEKCHSPTKWIGNDLNFAHAVDSTFKLVGKHSTLDCAKCHKPKSPQAPLGTAVFKGLSQDCKGCHEDQHRQQFAADCTSCHSPVGWKKDKLSFDHDKNTRFPLVAKHAAVACEKCHLPRAPGTQLASAQFRNLKSECADCHKDPHGKQFVAACTSCHSPAGWKKDKLSFDHGKNTKFPLVEKHAAVACAKCHLPRAPGTQLASAQFCNLKSECADCHKDPHGGQFERVCTKCHLTPVAWSVARLQIEHNKDTKFPLSGKHASLDCIKCHKPKTAGGSLGSAKFRGLVTSCEECHKVKHPLQYGPSCTSCHTFASWPKKNPGIDHIFKIEIAGENLSGQHLLAKCSTCHDGVKIGSLEPPHKSEYVCYTCHQQNDPHKSVLGNNCFKCHSSDGWKGDSLRFDHDTMASFSLNQDHQKLACTKCHENGRWKPLDAKCESCHTKNFLEKRK